MPNVMLKNGLKLVQHEHFKLGELVVRKYVLDCTPYVRSNILLYPQCKIMHKLSRYVQNVSVY